LQDPIAKIDDGPLAKSRGPAFGAYEFLRRRTTLNLASGVATSISLRRSEKSVRLDFCCAWGDEMMIGTPKEPGTRSRGKADYGLGWDSFWV
jgi:hypothetical protein